MPALNTPALQSNFKAPDFSLKGVDGKTYSLKDLSCENGLVVMFICNHCPYVKAVIDKIVADMFELKAQGVASIAIMSNDTAEYPEDSFENMKKLATEKNFPFPYVIDETQEVAKAYGAVCTPDFFGFNRNLELQYRGRLDSAGRENKPVLERDLFNAMMQIAQIDKGPDQQFASVGCSIKWKSGN
jgi:peroxiredoxin